VQGALPAGTTIRVFMTTYRLNRLFHPMSRRCFDVAIDHGSWLEQGDSGIVYGRNIIQHRKPAGITRALMRIMHEGPSVDAALAFIEAA
jgi:DhnA family fructose-bisphosphate aldolase class Ia